MFSRPITLLPRRVFNLALVPCPQCVFQRVAFLATGLSMPT